LSLEKDMHYMQMALEQAEIAGKKGEVPVGAVLLLENGALYSAHNAPITESDATAHAEIQVIRAACRELGNYRLAGSTLYVSLEPCSMCAGAIIHARIDRLVYGAEDKKTGAVHSLYRLLSDPRLNHQAELESGLMADECGQLLRDFFTERRRQKKVSIKTS